MSKAQFKSARMPVPSPVRLMDATAFLVFGLGPGAADCPQAPQDRPSPASPARNLTRASLRLSEAPGPGCLGAPAWRPTASRAPHRFRPR